MLVQRLNMTKQSKTRRGQSVSSGAPADAWSGRCHRARPAAADRPWRPRLLLEASRLLGAHNCDRSLHVAHAAVRRQLWLRAQTSGCGVSLGKPVARAHGRRGWHRAGAGRVRAYVPCCSWQFVTLGMRRERLIDPGRKWWYYSNYGKVLSNGNSWLGTKEKNQEPDCPAQNPRRSATKLQI